MDNMDFGYLSKLVEQAQNGSADAFAELYAATYKKQYKFAYQYLKDDFLAQDALQEVYIHALKNLNRIRDSKLFLSWLSQINFRVCFDMYRKIKRNSIELADLAYEAEMVQIPGGNPEKSVANMDEREYIMGKVLDLPTNQSKAIIMKYYNNMRLEDIASALDCSLSTVKRYLAEGRKTLEKKLKFT